MAGEALPSHAAPVEGLDVLVSKVSAVDRQGRLQQDPIHDLRFRPTRPVPHEDGVVNEFKVSERNPGLLVIPPNLYHGWKVIGTEEAFIINMPTSAYDHSQPDALDLPYDAPQAPEIVPWRW